LQDLQGLLLHLRQRPPAHADVAARFLDPELPTQPVPTLIQATAPASWIDDPAAAHPEAAGLQELLRQQSARLSQVEAELEATRRTLAERRLVDRAKAVLMSRIGLSEELAFRTLQKASMDQNRRLVEVAQAFWRCLTSAKWFRVRGESPMQGNAVLRARCAAVRIRLGAGEHIWCID